MKRTSFLLAALAMFTLAISAQTTYSLFNGKLTVEFFGGPDGEYPQVRIHVEDDSFLKSLDFVKEYNRIYKCWQLTREEFHDPKKLEEAGKTVKPGAGECPCLNDPDIDTGALALFIVYKTPGKIFNCCFPQSEDGNIKESGWMICIVSREREMNWKAPDGDTLRAVETRNEYVEFGKSKRAVLYRKIQTSGTEDTYILNLEEEMDPRKCITLVVAPAGTAIDYGDHIRLMCPCIELLNPKFLAAYGD